MYLRTLLVWAAGIPITMALFVLVVLSLFIDRTGRLVHSIGALWCRVILALSGVHVLVVGAENLPKDRPVIIVSNHQGAFDIPVLQCHIPIQFRWVAKKSLFKIPVVGWSMSLAGYIGIERARSGRAYKSLEMAAEKVRRGTSVVLFPEGTRSPTGALLPFKKGSFLLAVKSGVDIVPVGIKGTRDIMKKGSLLITPADATLYIGKPMPSAGLAERELCARSRRAIEELLGLISLQMEF